MKERTLTTIVFLTLFSISIGYIFLQPIFDFSFSQSTLEINGANVSETLEYTPKIREYHTLYRNFYTRIMPQDKIDSNPRIIDFITINSVECSAGNSYTNNFALSPSMPYTESNEYGCSFGFETGFERWQSYNVSAEYILHPKTLIKYDNNYYIKFVAYSKNEHPLLIKNWNFHSNGISDNIITKNQQVIVYVPISPSDLSNYEITEVTKLDFQNSSIWELILTILPAFIFLAIWFFFGREKVEGDYPEELSQPPLIKRKAWEVSTYFHPPFGDLDKNFLPAMIMDFYNRKYLDIQTRKEGILVKSNQIYIKILRTDGLDTTETQIMSFLEKIGNIDKGPDGYFNIKSISESISGRMKLSEEYRKLQTLIKKKSKAHINYIGTTICYVVFLIWIFISYIAMNITFFYFVPIIIIVSLVLNKTSLMHKFKEEYYLEFQQWQGFNKYLSTLDSIKRSPPKGIVMWETYLVYATALGSGKKVLSAMKDLKIIDKNTYDKYTTLYSPKAFGSASTASSGGGGMGGGGGIGGGGGGGR